MNILVGVTQEQSSMLSSNTICIARTDSIEELREIYSISDVYINPTIEDNYPTTNLEAQCCLTPCLTYKTGGSPESVPKENIIEKMDAQRLMEKNFTSNPINKVNQFDMQYMIVKYLKIYRNNCN